MQIQENKNTEEKEEKHALERSEGLEEKQETPISEEQSNLVYVCPEADQAIVITGEETKVLINRDEMVDLSKNRVKLLSRKSM